MGEVFQARDTRLDRVVALHYAAEPPAVAQLQLDARAPVPRNRGFAGWVAAAVLCVIALPNDEAFVVFRRQTGQSSILMLAENFR